MYNNKEKPEMYQSATFRFCKKYFNLKFNDVQILMNVNSRVLVNTLFHLSIC